MKYRLSVRHLAEGDMAEAYDEYEAKQEGLGIQFHNEVAITLRRIVENPRIYQHSEMSRYRKAVLRKFPYCIYYCIIEDLIVVVAVSDARRDPERIRARLV